MAVSGIFFTLAMNLYTQAVKGQLAFTKKDAAYMQRSIDNVIPATTHPLQCKELKRGRIVVYNNLGSWVVDR